MNDNILLSHIPNGAVFQVQPLEDRDTDDNRTEQLHGGYTRYKVSQTSPSGLKNERKTDRVEERKTICWFFDIAIFKSLHGSHMGINIYVYKKNVCPTRAYDRIHLLISTPPWTGSKKIVAACKFSFRVTRNSCTYIKEFSLAFRDSPSRNSVL